MKPHKVKVVKDGIYSAPPLMGIWLLNSKNCATNKSRHGINSSPICRAHKPKMYSRLHSHHRSLRYHKEYRLHHLHHPYSTTKFISNYNGTNIYLVIGIGHLHRDRRIQEIHFHVQPVAPFWQSRRVPLFEFINI